MSTPAFQRFSAFGRTLALRGNHEGAWREAVSRLGWLGWTRADCGDIDVNYCLRAYPDAVAATRTEFFEFRCDRALIHGSTDLAALLDAFENHAKLLTASRAEGRLFVHAGAVSWQGRGLIIPGCSRSGKTTLVRALIDAGALYYSDEFAVLDAKGRMHPYPLPLSIRRSETQSAGRLPVATIGGRAATRPVEVALIAVTRHRSRARWRPRPLSPGQALLALMENTVAARRAPGTAMAGLRETVLRARAIETLRGDARRVAAAVLAEVDAGH